MFGLCKLPGIRPLVMRRKVKRLNFSYITLHDTTHFVASDNVHFNLCQNGVFQNLFVPKNSGILENIVVVD